MRNERTATIAPPARQDSVVRRHVRDLVKGTRRLVSTDLTSLSAGEVSQLLADQRDLESAVTAWRARLVAACSDDVLDRNGASNKAELLRSRLRYSASEAKKQADLANGLASMPGAAGALADGRIGADAARRLADAASDGALGTPAEVEKALLGPATQMDPDRLGRHIRRRQEAARDASEQEARERVALARRQFRLLKRPDGMFEPKGLLTPHVGALLDAAIAAHATVDSADTPEEMRRTFAQRQHDALGDVAQSALDAPRTGPVCRSKPDVTVMIPYETWMTGEGIAELNGQPISGQLARRIACDAGISRLLTGPQSQPLDVGRATRNWSVAQRKAVTARDGHCRGPGCDRPASWCDIHHIDWWERDRGHTDIERGLLLCHRHHDLVHHGGWTIDLDPGTGIATWTSPLGEVVETTPEGAVAVLLAAEPPTTGPPEPRQRPGSEHADTSARVLWRDTGPARPDDDRPPSRTSDQLALAGTSSRAP